VTEVFGRSYAAAYDLLYGEKDYEHECDLIEKAARHFDRLKLRRILDLGCGTGGHAIPLARRGYEVVGVDRSAEMLAEARRKAAVAGVQARFLQGDLRSVRLGERFDLVAMMFAVLGYQISDDDVHRALATCRAHLERRGLLVFDVWHGPAVISQRPGQRTRRVPTASGELERTSFGILDEARDVCTVRIDVVERSAGEVMSETSEEHAMRYFFPEQLATSLADAGFEEARFSSFMELEREPTDADWNMFGVAAAA
jgi:SAM-dependent methyltransferase